ncbi:MAG: molybdopterin-guanine dinucleotide biosynthesis protein B [Thermoleophilia bacterium]
MRRLVPPVLSVVGCSGSGKTRLITALIPLLAQEGLRVGALKNAHSSFEVDRPGKDSWSMREAGATSVVLSSSGGVALMETTPTPWSLEDLVGLFAGRVDVVIAEGHGTPGWAVVEVWRSEVSAAPMLPLQDVLALVTDDEVLEPCRRISPDRPADVASLVLASIGF